MNKRIKFIDLIIYFTIIIAGLTLLVSSVISSSKKNKVDSSQYIVENEKEEIEEKINKE